MINKQVLNFLSDLSVNNNREWFQENKNKYLQAKENFEVFINLLIHEISKFDGQIKGLEARNCTFRIYRDVRFSSNKSPYKTNMGAYISRGGRKSPFAGYYFHLQPGESFLAGGIYSPSSAALKIIRNEIHDNLDEFEAIVENSSFRETYTWFAGDKLKTTPRDFPKDAPGIEWLRYKNYTPFHALSDEEISRADLLTEAIKIYRELYPLNEFFNRALLEHL